MNDIKKERKKSNNFYHRENFYCVIYLFFASNISFRTHIKNVCCKIAATLYWIMMSIKLNYECLLFLSII